MLHFSFNISASQFLGSVHVMQCFVSNLWFPLTNVHNSKIICCKYVAFRIDFAVECNLVIFSH